GEQLEVALREVVRVNVDGFHNRVSALDAAAAAAARRRFNSGIEKANTRNTERASMARLIGRVRKIVASPWQITKDRRRFCSSTGPSTRPKINGAAAQSSLRNTKSSNPKLAASSTSKDELDTL